MFFLGYRGRSFSPSVFHGPVSELAPLPLRHFEKKKWYLCCPYSYGGGELVIPYEKFRQRKKFVPLLETRLVEAMVRYEKLIKEQNLFCLSKADLAIDRYSARREVSDLPVCVTELASKVRALYISGAVLAEAVRRRNKYKSLLQSAAVQVTCLKAGYAYLVSRTEPSQTFLRYGQKFLFEQKKTFLSF